MREHSDHTAERKSGEMMERLDKIIASQGVYTRNEVKKLALNRRIIVNGVAVAKADVKVDPYADVIVVDGKPLKFQQRRYLVLNKPTGYTSTIEGNRANTIMDLVPYNLYRDDLIPAGRLDRDASGLMIITNDGELAHNITSPRKQVRKIYEIMLNIPVTEAMAELFAAGIQLSRDECKRADIEITGEKTCRVSTLDGRYFQIKQMFERCGAGVIGLHRICIGNLFLPDDLEPGLCRELTNDELTFLQEKNSV